MRIVEPDSIVRCFWQVYQDDDGGDGRYWAGGCEGDKQGQSQNIGEPLILECNPNHFAVGTRIEERLNTCPECGLQVLFSSVKSVWVCDSCKEAE